jgi:exodeoxyribonuclease VII small subunit
MKEMTYEQAYAKLEEYTEQLESGELTLDESLQVFEKAVALIRYCGEKLDGAKKQMQVLVEGLNGEMVEKPFNPEDYRG